MVEEAIDGRSVINQPAGHLEPGEELLAAVCREVDEETAWTFQPEALVGVYRWHAVASDTTFLRFCFCGGVSDHRPEQPLDPVIHATHWLSRAELAARPLRSPQVLRAIDDYLAGERFPLGLLKEVR